MNILVTGGTGATVYVVVITAVVSLTMLKLR